MKQNPLWGVTVVRLEMVKEEVEYYGKKKVNAPGDVAEVARHFIGKADREMFIAISLSTNNGINSVHVVSIGALDRATIHPRECFKVALLSNASRVVFAHNHPSGNIEPSPEDKNLTNILKQCGDLLDVKVLDHVIIGDSGYFSFQENRML